MQKYNILFVETGFGFGGATTCLAALIKGLNKKKYNPLVLSTHNDNATKKLIKNSGAKFYYIKRYSRNESVAKLIIKANLLGSFVKMSILVPIIVVEKLFRIPFFIKLLLLIRKDKIHLVHINTGLNNNAEVALASRLLKIPCICHVRGGVHNSTEVRFFSKYISCFISVSTFIKNRLNILNIPEEKIKTAYDGIDMNDCEKKASYEGDDLNRHKYGKYNIGIFGCLLPWKGHEVFIRAVDALIRNRQLEEAKFFIVGDVPDNKTKFKNDLIELVNKLELPNYIIFTGYQENVYKFMNKMDVVVHTSVSPEPFGMVIIEAMALGKPVIATKMGGPLEIINDGVNGFLIDPNNPELLAETILSILKNENELKKVSKKAKEIVEQQFNIINYIKNIENIYEEVLQ